MVRKLRHHEKKLLKKVDFVSYKEDNIRELQVMQRYHIEKREDYHKYNKLVGQIKSFATKVKELHTQDELRLQLTDQLLNKIYEMGLIPTKKSLLQCEKLTVSAFCRRRLPVMLVRLKFCETMKEAVTFVEHGHIRIGPNVVTDPAFLCTRSMEDFITWVDTSKIKRKVMKYNDKLDDFDLL
mmetsp:Transcript_29592/g.76444  ORF Transcript_29592/g.76444 Transcript_29592/m.76444 type:complete len:182 (-) Transcript_29592:1200-1745(-)